MIRILKAFGLAATAAMALGAFYVPAAQAQTLGVFSAGANTALETSDITGDQVGSENFFEVAENKITCDNEDVEYTGTIENGAAEEIEVIPSYDDCLFGETFETTIEMNGCQYVLTQPEEAKEHEYKGPVDLKCEEGKHIDIVVHVPVFGTCAIKLLATGKAEGGYVTEQLGGDALYSVDTGDPHDMEVTAGLEGISYTIEDGGPCDHEESEAGKFTSSIALRAFENEEPHTNPNANDLWIASVERNGPFTGGPTTEEHATTYLTGDQVGSAGENYLNVPGYGEVTCENSGVGYTGAIAGGTAEELTIAASYESCVGFGSFETDVDMTGCDYEFLKPEYVEEHVYEGETNLTCPEGKHVDVAVTTFLGNCDFTFLPEDGLGDVTYTVNTGEPHDVTMDVEFDEIPWTLDPTTGICNEHDEGENAEFKSTVIVTGFEDEETHEKPVDVWIGDE